MSVKLDLYISAERLRGNFAQKCPSCVSVHSKIGVSGAILPFVCVRAQLISGTARKIRSFCIFNLSSFAKPSFKYGF